MNKTPRTIPALVALAVRARVAALDPTLNLRLRGSDAPVIGEDLYDLMGRAADPTAVPPIEAVIGKNPTYVAARGAHAAARAEYRVALKTAREFVAQAVDTLKVKLGRRWNSRWSAVGFTNGSLELPAQPIELLGLIAAYYERHPQHEAAVFDLTAENAKAVADALVDAQSAVDATHAAEARAKRARDVAFKQLRGRITLLREELTLLLPPDDSRWYRFGFRRPVDGQTPDLVEKVELRSAGESDIVAEWTRSRLAENYRVSWKAAGSTAEPTEVGLFKDRQANLRDLPRGAAIVVLVTARNSAGESAPTEGEITLVQPGELT